MKKYCPECGKQNPIGAKFCCHCGNTITLQSKAKAKASLRVSQPGVDEGDDEEPVGPITATQLDVEIMDTQPFVETIGSLASQGGGGGDVPPIDTKGIQPVDQKAFLEEFRREAGPIRGDQQLESSE
jgi:ribosomal protein L40E